MNLVLRLVTAALLAVVTVVPAVAEEATLANPSFEEPDLVGWSRMTGATLGAQAPASEVVRDGEVARTGEASLRFRSTHETRAFHLAFQQLDVSEHRRVTLSAFARTEDVRREGHQFANANLTLSFVDGRGNRLGFHVSPQLTGDRDWSRLVVQAIAPPGTTRVQLGAFCSLSGTFWVDDFDVRIDPVLPFTAESRDAAVDALLSHLDRTYSYFGFGDRPDDGATLFAPHAEAFAGCADESTFVDLVVDLLADLRDPHVWVQTRRRVRPTVPPVQPLRNWNFHRVDAAMSEELAVGPQFRAAQADGIGYLRVNSFMLDQGAQDALRRAVVALDGARALIIDLRANSGGNEEIAQWLFGRFTESPLAYARNVVRDPTRPAPDGFAPPVDRLLRPVLPGKADPRRVVVLQGGWCMSSAEGALLMAKALPNATTVGRTSRGASGNPQIFDLLPGVIVRASTWQATDLDGRQVQDQGVEPDHAVDVEPRSYAERDAEFEKALELLRDD